jgi:hypothetical protein
MHAYLLAIVKAMMLFWLEFCATVMRPAERLPNWRPNLFSLLGMLVWSLFNELIYFLLKKKVFE